MILIALSYEKSLGRDQGIFHTKAPSSRESLNCNGFLVFRYLLHSVKFERYAVP